MLTEASCVRGISLDRLPLPLFRAQAGPWSHARGGSSPHARLAEPPLLLHHLADSRRQLDADSRGRQNVSLTFPPAGWLDRVDWNHAACKRDLYFPFWVTIRLWWWERTLQANKHLLVSRVQGSRFSFREPLLLCNLYD